MASKRYSEPPEMKLEEGTEYHATFHTDKGDIRARLFAEEAPITVNNFVFLARDGYFDGTTFHRVIKNFMVQGGDPTGTGTGDPGYRIPDEFSKNLRHDRPGILSMANAGPDTGGSQFFITYAATPHLDDRHAIFGEVVEGIDTLDEIRERDPQRDPQPGDGIESVEIQETRE